jgi:DNA (cytosine-5)-methyltransferase 1
MGLERGWVVDLIHQLTPNQQITALGNGVVPLQASMALSLLMT